MTATTSIIYIYLGATKVFVRTPCNNCINLNCFDCSKQFFMKKNVSVRQPLAKNKFPNAYVRIVNQRILTRI
jgi:hypothetical protein